MKYSKVELGQIEALLNKLGGMEGMKHFLAGKMKVVPVSEAAKKPVKKPGVLVRDGYFSAVELTARHDPRQFYQTKAGLYVWSDFVDRIVAVASPSEAGRTFKKAAFWKLTQNATGETLMRARPKNVWTATDFCAWLSVKLAKQPSGENGELLNTGWANLFLVEGVNRGAFVVDVVWDSGYRGWLVGAWRLGDGWDSGDRFASRPIGL